MFCLRRVQIFVIDFRVKFSEIIPAISLFSLRFNNSCSVTSLKTARIIPSSFRDRGAAL
jgi:hypothetical protein